MGFKRFTALLAAVMLVGCTGTASPQTETETPADEPQTERTDPYLKRAQGLVSELDTRTKLEQLLVLSIQTYNGQPFAAMNEETTSFFSSHSFGGFILFSSNCQSPAETATLTHDLQAAAVQDSGIPLLTAIDQEGGSLVRLSGGTETPGNMALGASGKASLAKASASILASELAAVGVNTNFAPDADVNSEPKNPIIGIRSFSDDPLLTGELCAGYIAGMTEGNVIACAKHFPGHGNTSTDSHTGLPVISSTKEEIVQKDLIPFHSAIEADVDMIMSAHICFPAIETDTYTSIADGSAITLPATLSDDLIQGVLRSELGYEGVVITDSLLMDAIKVNFDRTDAAVMAINAGVDLLLMPVLIEDANGLADVDAYLDALEEKVGTELSEERLNEAVTRILRLKAKRGVLDLDVTSDVATLAETASATVGKLENHQSERAIADQCVTVIKNGNDILPFTQAGKVVIAGPQSSQVSGLQAGYEQLIGEMNLAIQPVFVNYSYGREAAQVLNEIPGASAVIITSWLDNMSQFDPSESIMIPSVQQIIASCREQGVPCIVISTGLPYDLSCYQDADALLAVYNPRGQQTDENGAPVGSLSPNIPAALDIIFGYAHPSATLPVNIPETDQNGPTDTIVYPRGTGLTW